MLAIDIPEEYYEFDDEDDDNTPLNNFTPIKRKGNGGNNKNRQEKRQGKQPWRNATNKRKEFVEEEREYENKEE